MIQPNTVFSVTMEDNFLAIRFKVVFSIHRKLWNLGVTSARYADLKLEPLIPGRSPAHQGPKRIAYSRSRLDPCDFNAMSRI